MKYSLFFPFFFLYLISATAQNLVPNPNFALHNSCPDNYGQIEKCMYWYNPTTGTPDYFNACHDTLTGSTYIVGVPNNALGTQSSLSNAYIGIGTFSLTSNYREYARANIPALIPGAVYKVLIKVSLGDNSSYATNAPSIFFYREMDSFKLSHANLPYTPQITFNSAGHITDMVNWVTVIDTFTADSAYTHLIMGNFNDDASTSKTFFSGTAGSYYYIDSISVEKIADPSIINTNAQGEIKATLYPNPFTESAVLNIENLPVGNYTLSLMNVQGAVVREIETIRSGQTIIQREGLPPGFYYYRLQAGGTTVLRDKLIIH